jgi:pantothenate kinase
VVTRMGTRWCYQWYTDTSIRMFTYGVTRWASRSDRSIRMAPRVVVGIAGGSASGKSVLAGALAAALQRLHQRRVHILTTDRYM